MAIQFIVLGLKEYPKDNLRNTVQLEPNNWDDFSFKTLFNVVYQDQSGNRTELGSTKIGYRGQASGWTTEKLPRFFDQLTSEWFSVGQDVDFYVKLRKELPEDVCSELLASLRDLAANESILTEVQDEEVFKTSLMRYVGISILHGQFRRALRGEALLDDFDFSYKDDGDDKHAEFDLRFCVKAESKPPTNIHVIIGRNGVGKTTLLNNMIKTLLPGRDQSEAEGKRFYSTDGLYLPQDLPEGYFSSVVSVSFSVFDPFVPPPDQPDPELGLRYFYIGMKKYRSADNTQGPTPLKDETELVDGFVESFESCISQASKKKRWSDAIDRLCSDDNFAEMRLGSLIDLAPEEAVRKARSLMKRMSSGHKIVLLTITSLVNTVEEKTLVLIDEPESHLHPPLLSAFTRALSDLLYNRNGVAIIATHSPVVAQEVPKSCVWILNRFQAEGRSDRPERETFGENVGLLTKDIFGLEVSKSGFHEMLERAVNRGDSYDQILRSYSGNLGMEAQTILMSLIHSRDSTGSQAR